VGLQVDLLVCPKEARMDIAQRQRQQIILLHPADDRQVWHAVANQGIRHSVADFQGIATSIWHTGNGGLEKLAALASGLLHADVGDNPGTAMESGNVSNTSCYHMLTFSLCPTLRTGVMLRLDRLVLHVIGLAADKIGISHRGLLLIVGSIPSLSGGAFFTSAVSIRYAP